MEQGNKGNRGNKKSQGNTGDRNKNETVTKEQGNARNVSKENLLV